MPIFELSVDFIIHFPSPYIFTILVLDSFPHLSKYQIAMTWISVAMNPVDISMEIKQSHTQIPHWP